MLYTTMAVWWVLLLFIFVVIVVVVLRCENSRTELSVLDMVMGRFTINKKSIQYLAKASLKLVQAHKKGCMSLCSCALVLLTFTVI